MNIFTEFVAAAPNCVKKHIAAYIFSLKYIVSYTHFHKNILRRAQLFEKTYSGVHIFIKTHFRNVVYAAPKGSKNLEEFIFLKKYGCAS